MCLKLAPYQTALETLFGYFYKNNIISKRPNLEIDKNLQLMYLSGL